ncbi:MAG: FecR domain-containing protein [Fuerstiella sp.]
MNDDRFEELVQRFIDDHVTESQIDELVDLCRDDEGKLSQLREHLRLADLLSQYEAELRSSQCFVDSLAQRKSAGDNADDFVARVVESAQSTSSVKQNGSDTFSSNVSPRTFGDWRWKLWLTVASIAALLMVGFVDWQSRPVATLASSENAAWESVLPTTPGSRLKPGLLQLRSGVATVQFDSGASVVLEAPAGFELVSSMKARLVSGAAIFDVPDSAIGFTVETPEGYAIDYGTRFAVQVEPEKQRSEFELIEGEIAVHHPSASDEIRLTEAGRSVSISGNELIVEDSLVDHEPVSRPTVIRVATGGRITSVLHAAKRHLKWHAHPLSREVFTAKRTDSGAFDHYSLLEFDASGVPFDEVQSVELRVNLVPSSRGLAARLPRVSRFGIYGLPKVNSTWGVAVTWENAPQPSDGVLLGTFEVPRSQQRGNFMIGGEKLLSFLRDSSHSPVTLIISRETSQLEGVGPGLTHMFASHSHPESVGPVLEFTLNHSRKILP